eukprot:scaffold684_cov345-Pavlova_lutheri.AAC.60
MSSALRGSSFSIRKVSSWATAWHAVHLDSMAFAPAIHPSRIARPHPTGAHIAEGPKPSAEIATRAFRSPGARCDAMDASRSVSRDFHGLRWLKTVDGPQLFRSMDGPRVKKGAKG